MAQTGTYSEELENELKHTDPNSHAYRLLAQEIDRLTKGEDEKKERPPVQMIDLHLDRPQKIALKVRIPVKEHPRYNFVGKLLGPKGMTLKALQDQTGCKMAVMGKGSMREKEKEEELRKEGGKYAHLNEDLHVLVESYAEMSDGYNRLAIALAELKKFVVPDLSESYEVPDMGMNGGAPRGRGGYRGGPPERGGRGGFRGRGNGPAPVRGALLARGGGPPPRGAPRGAPSARGAPARGAPRGARAAATAASYDYSAQGYGAGYDGYDDGYGQAYSAGQDPSYYDYGSGTSGAAAGYDSYSGGGYGDYSEGWSTGGKAAPAARGSSRAQGRSHPYARTASGDY